MAITINVKGYEKPFTFPDGTPQEEIEAALRTIPPAPVNPAKEALAVADTGVRGSLVGLPALFGDAVTGQSEGSRKLLANLAESLPGPGGALAAQDLRTRKTPLTSMAPSAVLEAGMQRPQTEPGKLAADVTAGTVGSFMPGSACLGAAGVAIRGGDARGAGRAVGL